MTSPISVTARAGRREWLALVVLVLAVTLLAIDATVLYLAVPALVADLAPSATQLLWIGDIYSFALAGLLITMGNLADRIGRKRLLIFGSVAFGLASVVAAFSATPEMLIAARVLLGLAGATIMPSTLSIVRNIFEDPAQRTRAVALWSAGAAAGAALGPLVGGALLENFWWGSVFLINVPVMVVIVIAGLALLPESRNPNAAAIDLASAVLSIGAIVPLVYAVKHTFSTGVDWSVPVTAALAVVSGILFAKRQRTLPVPLVDLSLFRMPAFAGAVGSVTLAIFAFSGVLFFFSQYLQLVRGYGPLQAGIAELPVTLSMIAVVLVIGWVLSRLGMGRAISLGLATAGMGLAGMGFTEGHSSYWGLGVSLVVLGLGVGVAMTLAVDAVVTAVPRERAGAASAISETGYELGIALGIAVLGSLQMTLYRVSLDLPANLDAQARAAVEDSLPTATGYFTQSGDDSLAATARHAFTEGMQITSFIAAAILVAAAILAWRVIPSTKVAVPDHDPK